MDEGWVPEVVQTAFGEDLRSCLEPDGLAELDSGVFAEELRGEASEGAQHGPSGMDDLELAVLGEGLGIGRETGSVPSVVTWEFPGEVWRDGALRVRSEPQGAVGSVELDGGLGYLSRSLSFLFG